jgi:large subunit ribosomal protein L4
MKFDLYTQSGEKKGQVEASDKIFGIKPNSQLIHQALLRQRGGMRQSSAHVKKRGEVTGSGIKIYRQKGTGNARHGDRYANLFKGGGRSFGPRNEKNYTTLMPRKQRRLALFSLLSVRANENAIFALESFEMDVPKTKTASQMLTKLPVKKNMLIVSVEAHPTLEKSFANIPNAKVIQVNYLNPDDLLKYQTVLFLKDALTKAEELFLTTEK